MIASFRERLGSKLAGHRHHGQTPGFKSPLHHGSDSGMTAETFQGLFGGLSVLKLILLQSKKQQQRTTTLALSIQYITCIPTFAPKVAVQSHPIEFRKAMTIIAFRLNITIYFT